MNEVEVLRRENDELRERIRQLEAALSPLDFLPPVEWGLTGKESALYAHLASREAATKQSIMTALYSIGPDDEPDMKIVDVFVCNLRAKLKPFGIRIGTIWGVGYRLETRSESEAA